MADSPILDIDAEQLRELMRNGAESTYMLVDVREVDEYRKGHIPGAQNVPLTQIAAGEAPIPQAEQTIFYCLGGVRSLRAAQIAIRRGEIERIWNLTGGIAAWSGHVLPKVPNLRVFGRSGTLAEVLRSALELEKGAQRLYHTLATELTGTPHESLVRILADAEVGHARELYDQLAQHEGSIAPFEEVYAECPGDILESGEAFDELAAIARRDEPLAAAAVLQLALDMELGAYDLYRSAAVATEKPSLKALFLGLAEHEKGHARALSGAVADLAPSV